MLKEDKHKLSNEKLDLERDNQELSRRTKTVSKSFEVVVFITILSWKMRWKLCVESLTLSVRKQSEIVNTWRKRMKYLRRNFSGATASSRQNWLDFKVSWLTLTKIYSFRRMRTFERCDREDQCWTEYLQSTALPVAKIGTSCASSGRRGQIKQWNQRKV